MIKIDKVIYVEHFLRLSFFSFDGFFFAETNFCCQEVISLDAYKAAAQENAEFLACLGIEWDDSELPFFFCVVASTDSAEWLARKFC